MVKYVRENNFRTVLLVVALWQAIILIIMVAGFDVMVIAPDIEFVITREAMACMIWLLGIMSITFFD